MFEVTTLLLLGERYIGTYKRPGTKKGEKKGVVVHLHYSHDSVDLSIKGWQAGRLAGTVI